MNPKHIYYQSLLLIHIIILAACTPKQDQVEIIKKQTPIKKNVVDNSDKEKLDTLANVIIQNCNAILSSKQNANQNDFITVEPMEDHMKINLNNKNDFTDKYHSLIPKAKEQLLCMIPLIKALSPLTIQLVGHANGKDTHKKQHLSDNRAITVAELFFNEGIRDEIFAKGCLEEPDSNGTISQEIDIYIYVNKSNMKNNCN